MIRSVLIGFVLLLAGCSPDVPEWTAAPQEWNDLAIRIETRPTVVRPGMNEFLVIANRKQRGFSSDLMVDVRTENSPWKQAMPDGALGIYRRALPVKDVQQDHLYVRLVRRGEQHEMIFDLSPRAGSEGQTAQ